MNEGITFERADNGLRQFREQSRIYGGAFKTSISASQFTVSRLAKQGLAVVMISSYLPEIVNLFGLILICCQGRMTEKFLPGQATEEKVIYAAAHGRARWRGLS